MALAAACSVDGCKRAATCLCHHCKENVCSKHFNEHQVQLNNELLPLTDRLNELKMKLQHRDSRNGPLATLEMWRDQKYQEIDQEYNRRIQEFDRKISEKEKDTSHTIGKIAKLIDEGEVSLDQIEQLKKEVDIMENQVNTLMTSEQEPILPETSIVGLNLVNTYIQLGRLKYLVKERVSCRGKDLYALESEMPFTGYDGLCPQCRTMHVSLQADRGFYVLCKTLHEQLKTT